MSKALAFNKDLIYESEHAIVEAHYRTSIRYSQKQRQRKKNAKSRKIVAFVKLLHEPMGDISTYEFSYDVEGE